jgi:flagellar biosynthesis/type III secretory pathway chaperone
MLEQMEYGGLDEVVTSKARLIADLNRLEQEVAATKHEIGMDVTSIPPGQRELLHCLEDQARELITRVSEVDSRNRQLLEQFRSQTVENWLVNQQQLHLHRLYQKGPRRHRFREH